MAMEDLLTIDPASILLYGPKKLLLDRYVWHSPGVGIIGAYEAKEKDTEDHYEVFRGVDMIEAFAQATIVSMGVYLERSKGKYTDEDLRELFLPLFIGVGNVSFHHYIKKGETFISMGHITFYKFRQMTCDGRIYKVPAGLDLVDYFSNYTDEKLKNYDLGPDFKLVANLEGITGRAMKKETLKNFI